MENLSGHYLKHTRQQGGLPISDVSGKTNQTLSCLEHSGAPFKDDIDQRARERSEILAHDFLKNI